MTDLDVAADFIWRHARLLDRHRFAHLFLGADPEPVVRALRAHQNDDGGFGHALEPDLRTPASQPGAGQHVLEILAEAGRFDDPMVADACDFLASIARDDGGVPFVLLTALEHPRAPWWQPADESSLILDRGERRRAARAGREPPVPRRRHRVLLEPDRGG